MAERTCAVQLWDHDLGAWSPALATECLGGRAAGLSAREAVLALRRLRAAGWDDDLSICVAREGGGAC